MESFTTITSANFISNKRRSLLFDVTCSLEIPIKNFDENWWSLVSNIWTQWNSYKQTNGNVQKDFTCRLMKHWNSSTRKKENIPNEKCRITKTQLSNLYRAKIRVLWLVSLELIKVERYKDSLNYTHSLLELERVKHSQAVRILVKKEAIKNYPLLAIISAVKEYVTKLDLGTSVEKLKCKEVANIKYKIQEPLKAHLICNSNLKSDILKSMAFLIEKGYRVESYCVSRQFTSGIVFAHPKQLEKLQCHG
ncbi:hypothetical protein Glove_24g41 [Diversispora epigaea]|uniref:Uncharacterized protein n=1 Tax=Diversispora epigaea TaxID=1348612 RepID=A0A397JSS4_9GLOM|nr:hypothetical protein Glove_24g41 [Diversispora epigaea]